MAAIRVFVYGTLRASLWNHALLRHGIFLDDATTVEQYWMYADVIPFVSKRPLYHSDEKSNIIGEVYAVNAKTLQKLDALEGHPVVYRREKTKVLLKSGKEVEAWLYFCDKPTGVIVASGNFLLYSKHTPTGIKWFNREEKHWPFLH